MKHVFVDPGKRGCGVAVFDSQGWLQRAAFVDTVFDADAFDLAVILGTRVIDWVELDGAILDHCVYIEHPEIYPGMAKTDPNDLFPLVAVGAVISQAFYERYAVKPKTWKGSVNADVMTSRILSKITSDELAKCEKCLKSKAHNMYDAVGMGLWKFKRLNQKVYPGALGGKSDVTL